MAFTTGGSSQAEAAPPETGSSPAPQRPTGTPPVLPEPAPEPAAETPPGTTPETPVLPDPATEGAAPTSPAPVPPPQTEAEAESSATTQAPAIGSSGDDFGGDFDTIMNEERAEFEGETTPDESRKALLRPSDKRRFFSLNLGVSAPLVGALGYFSYYGALGGPPMRIETAVGSHFKRKPTMGAAFVISDTLGGFINSVHIGARLQWDKPLSKHYAIYSQSMVTMGFRVNLLNYGILPLPYGVGGFVEGSWGAKILVAERLSLSFRPVNVELVGDTLTFVGLNWNVMVGMGTVW